MPIGLEGEHRREVVVYLAQEVVR